ncbi:MAG: hypothetical protein KN64_14865 [Sulfurovum sp. AS07-7]|nr:MAG: hypothetical protein KN64_14865 [Sulfurovum sp. AS07-7]
MGYADTYGKIPKPENNLDAALKNPNLSSLALAKVLQGSNLFKTTQSYMPQFSGNDRLTAAANVGLGVVQSRNNMKADMARNNIISDLVKTHMSGQNQLAQEQARAKNAMDIAKFNGNYEQQRIANEKQHYANLEKQALMNNATELYRIGAEIADRKQQREALAHQNQISNNLQYNEMLAKYYGDVLARFKDISVDDMTPEQKALYNQALTFFPNATIPAQNNAQTPRLDKNQEKIAYEYALKDFGFDPHKGHIDGEFIDFGDGRKVNAYDYYQAKLRKEANGGI